MRVDATLFCVDTTLRCIDTALQRVDAALFRVALLFLGVDVALLGACFALLDIDFALQRVDGALLEGDFALLGVDVEERATPLFGGVGTTGACIRRTSTRMGRRGGGGGFPRAEFLPQTNIYTWPARSPAPARTPIDGTSIPSTVCPPLHIPISGEITMSVSTNRSRSTLALRTLLAGAALALPAAAAHAQVYNWLTWTYPNSTTATAVAPGLGSVGLTVTGPNTQIDPWSIQFNNVAFTPTLVNTPAPRHTVNAFETWSTTINLANLDNTNGVVVGVGNFGYGTVNYPGYRLVARDWCGSIVPLSTFTVLGSCDHTSLTVPGQFNDNVSLNLVTGVFTGTPVHGLDGINTDILLIRCPAHLGSLTIETLAPSAGDTLFVVVSTPRPCSNTGCITDIDDGSGTGTPDGGTTIDDLLYYLQQFELGC